ncbi:MAG TPA: hypothetical protein ENF58_00975 [Candidatus Altiarchaeales archaeon]|nr:hypothetical protein [Candidatus Altiarchaeales archaeon]
MAEKTDQSGYYAFAVITLAKFMHEIEPIIGTGARALMRRPLAKILAGSGRFERTGHVSFKEAVDEGKDVLNEMGCFGPVEIIECDEKNERVVYKSNDFILRYKEYGKTIGEMDSTSIFLGLIENFIRDATGDKEYRAHLDSFDEETCTVRVDKSLK